MGSSWSQDTVQTGLPICHRTSVPPKELWVATDTSVKGAKGTAKLQKVSHNCETISQEAVFVPSFYISSLFLFSLFFFPFSSSSSVLSLVNNAYCSHCYADRQRQVVYQRIKLYSELQCNSCNLVPCGWSRDSESIRDPCSVLTDKVTGDIAQCLTFGLFPT